MDENRRSLEKVLFGWIGHLVENEKCISGLSDLQDGITFPILAEKVTGISVRNLQNTPDLRKSQKKQNVDNALTVLKNIEGLSSHKYKSLDILSGKPKVLDFLMLMFKYYLKSRLKQVGLTGPDPYTKLKEWMNGELDQLYEMHNLGDNLRSAKAIAGLVHAANPDLFPDWASWLDVHDANKIKLVLAMAEEVGVKRWLYPDHFSASKIDEDSMVIYLHQFLDAQNLQNPYREPGYQARGCTNGARAMPRPYSTPGSHLSRHRPQARRVTSVPDDYQHNTPEYVRGEMYSEPDPDGYPLYPDADYNVSQQNGQHLYKPASTQNAISNPNGHPSPNKVKFIRGPQAAPRFDPILMQNLDEEANAATDIKLPKPCTTRKSTTEPVLIPQSRSEPRLSSRESVGAQEEISLPSDSPHSSLAMSDLSSSPDEEDSLRRRRRESLRENGVLSYEDLMREILASVTLADDTKKHIMSRMKNGKLSIHQPDKPIATGRYGDVIVTTHTVRLREHSTLKGTFQKYTGTTVKGGQVTSKFLEESVNMLCLQNDNVIKVEGFCLDENQFFRLMEHMDKGVLRDYLIKHEQIMSQADLNSYAKGIGNGMCYLHEQGFVQRNLNCSTVWLCKTADAGLQVKIVDFGYLRDVNKDDLYVTASSISQCSLPCEWMAPEILARGDNATAFDMKTDMWSFGATLVELYDLGRTPYWAQNISGCEQILRFLKKGNCLKKPEKMPNEIWDEIAKPCLSVNPSQRPDFSTIHSHLDVVIKLTGNIPKLRQKTLHRYTQLCNEYDFIDETNLPDDIYDGALSLEQTIPKRV